MRKQESPSGLTILLQVVWSICFLYYSSQNPEQIGSGAVIPLWIAGLFGVYWAVDVKEFLKSDSQKVKNRIPSVYARFRRLISEKDDKGLALWLEELAESAENIRGARIYKVVGNEEGPWNEVQSLIPDFEARRIVFNTAIDEGIIEAAKVPGLWDDEMKQFTEHFCKKK